jgi:hypothetical protein
MATFADPKICSPSPSGIANKTRSDYIQTFAQICNEFVNVDCDDGIGDDVRRCGFAYNNDAAAYCQNEKTKDDSCCIKYYSASSSISEKSSGINLPLIIGASCAALALLCLIGFVLYKRRSASSKPSGMINDTEKHSPSNAFKRLSPFSPNPFFGGNQKGQMKYSSPGPSPLSPAYSNQGMSNYSKPLNQGDPRMNSPKMYNELRMNSPQNEIRMNHQRENQGYNDPRMNSPHHVYNEPRMNIPQMNPRITQDFRDQNAINNLNASTNKRIKAHDNFRPAMDDEVKIEIGDILLVHEEYDDGWAFGVNLCSRSQGMFPLAVGDILLQSNSSTMPQKKNGQNESIKSPISWFVSQNTLKPTTGSSNSKFERKKSLQIRAANNNKVRCLEQYTPSLDDEIYIRFDDVLIIFEKFDDGTDV